MGQAAKEKYHVAIVGGGIAGLYSAYRLRQAWERQPDQLRKSLKFYGDRLDVVILERNPVVLGGRIRTADLPTPRGSVRAELGAMRITTRHLLARHLFCDLGIQTVPFEGDRFSEHFFLRGKHFDARDVERDDPATFPYSLEAHEKRKTPSGLVKCAFETALQELSLDKSSTPKTLLVLEKLRSVAARGTLTHEDWLLIQKHGLLTGKVTLSNIGVWNLLHHYLSPEAASFVDGGFGYESVIGNWNVSDAIPWFIADFSPGEGYESIVGSFSEVVDGLRNRLNGDHFSCDVFKNAQVTVLERRDDISYRLTIASKEQQYNDCVPDEIAAGAVFLALPRRPLENLKISWLEVSEPDETPEKGAERRRQQLRWKKLLVSVRGHRLAKIVQAYRHPWWRDDVASRGRASRTFTDLPLRQVYYLDREWLAERGRYRNDDGSIGDGKASEIGGMIVAYLDGHYTSFWRFITAVQRMHDVREGKAIDREAAMRRELDRRESFGSRIWAWPPKDVETVFDAFVGDDNARNTALYLYFFHYGLYERAAAKVKHSLEWLHKPARGWTGASVPDPVCGAYTFWDDFSDDSIIGAGWHTWESGVSSASVINDLIRPFENENVYVCGEAYSSEQGWIEGALKSVELIMDRLGILLPDECVDRKANQDVKDRSARMRDHVGLPPRPESRIKPPMSQSSPIKLGDGDILVFLSGQIGFKPPEPPPDKFEKEAQRALESLLEQVQKVEGGAAADLVSVRVFLTTMNDYESFNAVYKEMMERAGAAPPVRTAIAVYDLPFGALVEVDGIAVVKSKAL